jgi:hypothetical protein
MRGWDFTNIRGDAARYESADAARYVGHLLKEHHRRAVAFDVDGEPQRVRVKAVSQDKHLGQQARIDPLRHVPRHHRGIHSQPAGPQQLGLALQL